MNTKISEEVNETLKERMEADNQEMQFVVEDTSIMCLAILDSSIA